MEKKLENSQLHAIIKTGMKELLHHFFLPRDSNNHRPKLLHHRSLLICSIVLFLAGFLLFDLRQNYPSVLGISSDISDQELLLKTNEKRQENGLSPLSLDPQLSLAAQNKASDMFSKDYWAHNSSDGTTPWFFIKSAGYSYVYAGENLARGFSNSSDVINAWMTSDSHRKNMLSPNYKQVGFAVQTGRLNGEETVLVVEMLGSTNLPTIARNETQKTTVSIASNSPVNKANVETAQPQTTPFVVNAELARTVLEAQKNTASIKPAVSGLGFSFNISRMIIVLFIGVFLMDMVIIERRKIVRLVGHNIDHILFLTLIMLFITVIIRGSIL